MIGSDMESISRHPRIVSSSIVGVIIGTGSPPDKSKK